MPKNRMNANRQNATHRALAKRPAGASCRGDGMRIRTVPGAFTGHSGT